MSILLTPATGTRQRYDNNVFVEKKLSNGIRVHLHQPDMVPSEEGCLILFLPMVGSCIEQPGEYGIAHFFEHVPFALEKLERIKALGGDFDGSTSLFWTKYGFDGPKENFVPIAELLRSLVMDPPITNEVVRREQSVITREYEMKQQTGGYRVQLAMHKSLFGSHHPLGHFPVGELPVIQGMTTAKLQAFHQAYYHAGNIQLIVGGAFAELGEAYLLEILDRVFGEIRHDVSVEYPNAQAPLSQRGKLVRLSKREFEREKSLISFFGPEILDDDDDDALDLLVEVLGGSLTSLLMRELRDKRGWIYETPCHHESTRFGWSLTYNCPTPKTHFPELLPIFREALTQVTPELLLRRQEERQLARKSNWAHPVGIARKVVASICYDGVKRSAEHYQAVEDRQTLERVFAWRDRLLAEKPFVFEAVTE